MSIASTPTSIVVSKEETSLWDGTKKFLKGDYDGPNALLIDTVLGLVPGVGQVIDARDIIRGLTAVAANAASFGSWFELITALIGLVPGGGDFLKRALRQVHRGVIRPEMLFDVIRRGGYGNPEKLIKECLDFSTLQKHLTKLLSELRAGKFLNLLPAETQRMVLKAANDIERGLAQQMKALQKWVDELLKKQPNSSAAHATPAGFKKTDKPGATGQVASEAKHNPAAGVVNTKQFDTIAAQVFGALGNQVKGIMGEHITDYHCIEVKGWGGFTRHDQAGSGKWQGAKHAPRKLNDGTIPLALSGTVRGRGIDGVWRTNQSNGKPYAIVEAKAYANPVQNLGAMLHDVYDKDEMGAWKKAGKSKGKPKGKPSGKPASANAQKKQTAKPQDDANGPKEPEQNIMQMSHVWIEQRLNDCVAQHKRAIWEGGPDGTRNYTRHVFLISAIDAYDHVRALVNWVQNKTMNADDHAKHSITREFTDRDLDIEEKKRVDKRATGKNK